MRGNKMRTMGPTYVGSRLDRGGSSSKEAGMKRIVVEFKDLVERIKNDKSSKASKISFLKELEAEMKRHIEEHSMLEFEENLNHIEKTISEIEKGDLNA
jgi:hypothetical protein